MNILSFDVESNGLHGEAFAVAGVVINDAGHTSSQIVLRCPIIGLVDPWVNDNVLEPMANIAQTHPEASSMRTAFWAWFIPAQANSQLVVCANPYPVEARFLIQCQEDDLPNRQLNHPFPLYDLSSMLLTLGYPTRPQRRAFIDTHV